MATEVNSQIGFDRSLFMPEMTVQAMRDSRYRHAANAVAELIDNSIDARANCVDVLIREEWSRVSSRSRWQVAELAVFDNGHGMSAQTLEQALRFGGRLESDAVHAIGKYGMGLPTASVSQCKRVDVWSWQNGIDSAAHSYIDVDAVSEGSLPEVPPANTEAPPEFWRDMASPNTLDEQRGTLVVWRDLDRITARSETIFNKLEQEIGRIYRHFINDGEVEIRMAAHRNGEFEPRIDKSVRPNDPLYLMQNSATPEPWEAAPMFNSYTVKTYEALIDGRSEMIEVNYSIAKPEILGQQGDQPGSRAYGKHARQNMGVSVVREGREILLLDVFIDRSAGGNSAVMNRWWGCEVKFGSGCDDLFGVDHNKQMASHFSSIAKEVSEDDYSDDDDIRENLEEDTALYNIVVDIRNTTRSMMRELGKMFSQLPRKSSPNGSVTESIEKESEAVATDVVKGLLQTGAIPKTPTDRDHEELDEYTRREEVKEHLVREGIPEDDAIARAEEAVKADKWFEFVPTQLSGYQVYSVTRKGGMLHVNLNINHPIYEFLNIIERQAEADTEGNEVARKAAVSIRAMLLAWARMEDEIEVEDARMEFQDTCAKWGRMMANVLNRMGADGS